MNYSITAHIVNEYGDTIGGKIPLDTMDFTSKNSIFCWFFYETFDAHELHDRINRIGIERNYSNDDLHLCRSRLLYYFEEDIDDLIKHSKEYEKENQESIENCLEDAEEGILDKDNEINLEIKELEVGMTVGYILKFIDRLIDSNKHIKITFN